jgi:antitoxin MazE
MWGNSLGIRIPKSIAEKVNLASGTEVELDTAGGVLTVRPVRQRRRSKYKLSDLLAKMKGPNPHGEMFGPPVGREIL